MARKHFHHPFEPYHIQQQFMEALYDCIENKQVGIFESPTGTGKSLSLICGSLTWLREHKRRTFDEALATVEIDDDEPDWMVDHARDARSREIRQMRAEFEARLSAVRERERKLKERATRAATEERPRKRQKPSKHDSKDADDEEQFVLDDYQSDNDSIPVEKAQYSAETTKLMESLGLLPKLSSTAEEEIEEMKIYFCSRTHSQLSQFVGELQRVTMPPGLPPQKSCGEENQPYLAEEVKHLTLGSRKNLCINPKVNKLVSQTAVNERCIELQQSDVSKDNRCSFLPSKDAQDVVLDFRDHALARIRDIEDLAKLGTKLEVCPYYASRAGIGSAEIVTLPYPLLLQKSAREALGISLKGHVVVIDEAHNLMNAVEAIYSARISRSQLTRARDGLIVYLQKFRNRLKGSNRTYLTQVVRVIDSLLSFIAGVNDGLAIGNVISPSALLAGKAADQINLAKLVRYIDESKLAREVEGYIAHIAQNRSATKASASSKTEFATDVPTLMHLQGFLLCLMHPSREGRFLWSKESGEVIIQYLLLDPSEHFRDIVEEARSVILAGGTMSPMEDYKQQLFPYLDNKITTFSCGHLIPSSSLCVHAVASDHEGRLDYSYKSRTDKNASRLGNALVSIATKVKGGMVVFFPSYSYLETVLNIWKSQAITARLEETKPMFYDSRTMSAEDTFRSYSDTVQSDKRGALLLSVIGGKLSEGINFSDDLGRCVVVVGLPYPNLESPDWKAKMQYLEERAAERQEPRGKASREHAENVCMRSVNQAIGRAIRHKNDWASIMLFDARYADSRIQSKLPSWIRNSMKSEASGHLQDILEKLGPFFEEKMK